MRAGREEESWVPLLPAGLSLFHRSRWTVTLLLVVILLLFWQVFGLPFSWPKGATGPEVVWIGAKPVVENSGPNGRGVRVEVPADRVDYLLEEVERFLAGNVIGRKQL